ncbi:kinase-like domain-containing protein [Paraphysoderma sedebokerense]|nr:kinase-like domain-containing protein [Paraphysoderma sedebokerense]
MSERFNDALKGTFWADESSSSSNSTSVDGSINITGRGEQDYLDGFGSIRNSYKQAFRDLVVKALDTIKRNGRLTHSRPDTLKRTTSEIILKSHSSVETITSILSKFAAPQVTSPTSDFPLASALFENLNPTRYQTDFIELKCLGKGGFGSVWHVKHRLDGLEYAVKKIKLKNGRAYEKILREAKFLARFDHRNICRYHSAWVENDIETYRTRASDGLRSQDTSFFSDVSSEIPSMNNSFRTDNPKLLGYDFNWTAEKTSESRVEIVFGDQRDKGSEKVEYDWNQREISVMSVQSSRNDTKSSASTKESVSGHIHMQRSSIFEISSSIHADSTTTIDFSVASNPAAGTAQIVHPPNLLPSLYLPQNLTLFIQMQLCHTTLHDYIIHRNATLSQHIMAGKLPTAEIFKIINPLENLFIFKQLVYAVKYIHDLNIIHRDITPKNVFISRIRDSQPSLDHNNETPAGIVKSSTTSLPVWMGMDTLNDIIVKLGDFGLVKEIDPVSVDEDSITLASVSSKSDENKAIVLRRPQLFETSSAGLGTPSYAAPEQLVPNSVSTTASDIYSLQLILFELYCPFQTLMERSRVLSDLKKGIVPIELVKLFPKEMAFVLWGLDTDPSKRPSIDDMIEFIDELEKTLEPGDSIASKNETSGTAKIVQSLEDTVIRQSQELLAKEEEIEQLRRKVSELESQLSLPSS